MSLLFSHVHADYQVPNPSFAPPPAPSVSLVGRLILRNERVSSNSGDARAATSVHPSMFGRYVLRNEHVGCSGDLTFALGRAQEVVARVGSAVVVGVPGGSSSLSGKASYADYTVEAPETVAVASGVQGQAVKVEWEAPVAGWKVRA